MSRLVLLLLCIGLPVAPAVAQQKSDGAGKNAGQKQNHRAGQPLQVFSKDGCEIGSQSQKAGNFQDLDKDFSG